MNHIPLGIVKYDDLYARCTALTRQRPDFAEALTALIEAEDTELYNYWMENAPKQLARQDIAVREPSRKQLNG